jgi:hypothetical protein
MVSKSGWITALVTSLLAALFFFRLLSANADAKLQRNNAELTQIELRALKQQLYAERILAERQISDLTNNSKTEPIVFARLQSSDATQPAGLLVWLQARQAGALFVDSLSPTSAEEEYRLWIADGSGSTKISAGVLTLTPGTSNRYDFKAEKAAPPAPKFIITREHKGAATPAGPTVFSATP